MSDKVWFIIEKGQAMSEDDRPRCEHLVVYPMDNCAVCMKAEIAKLKSDLLLLAKYASDDWCYASYDVTAARKLRDEILGEGK